jgi:pimeloyl-ACP methyl ester carboxylesterase
MKLNDHALKGINLQEWGTGNKVALLVHGLSSSNLTWSKLGKDLADMGYHVYAPDLKGHGLSERTRTYSITEWTKDILAMGLSPELLIGHSLGGIITAHLHGLMKPAKTVLIDPVIHLPEKKFLLWGTQIVWSQMMMNRFRFRNLPAKKIWDNTFKRELIGIKRWDINTVKALKPEKSKIIECLMSERDVLLMRAKGSYIVPQKIMAQTYAHNTELSYFPSSGHNIHLDSYEAFFEQLKHFMTKDYNIKELLQHGKSLPSETTL